MKLIRNLSCILACGLLFSCGGGGGGGGGETVEAPETLVPETPENPASTYSFTVSTSEISGNQGELFTMEFVCSAKSGEPQGTIESCKVSIPGYDLPVLKGGNWVQTEYSSGNVLHGLKFTCEGNNNGIYYKMQLLIHTLRVNEYVPMSYLLGKTDSADVVISYESGDKTAISVFDRQADITIRYH